MGPRQAARNAQIGHSPSLRSAPGAPQPGGRLTSGRAYFNLDWITLLVMAVVTVAGIVVYFAAHGGREIGAHMVDTDAPGYLPPPAPGRAAEEAGA
jgi:hypothetical protein